MSSPRFVIRTLLLLAGAGLLGMTMAAPSSGQTPAPAAASVDVTKLGPQVGEKVPDFVLADQDGRERTLSSLMGPKGLILVFNRSADW